MRTTRRQHGCKRTGWRALVVCFSLIVGPALTAAPAWGAVSVSRAELSGTSLRLEGTATVGRTITVDGVAMGTSDSAGRFRIDRSGYTAPADCTVDVNDGSATPRVATLSGCTVSSPPPTSSQPAPSLLTPANGASVTTPVPISWSQVLDPSSLNGGYNWQVSTSSTFASLVTADSTAPSVTQASVGGLLVGTYFWRVQAVSASVVVSAWSPARSFVVTGPGAGALAAPVLAPLPFGTAYHPFESFTFSWTAVTGASSYVVEASTDPAFPVPVAVRSTNEPGLSSGFTFHDTLIGSYYLRVLAVDSAGVLGPASNVRTFSISYAAPIGPPPTLASPADGATLGLPITLDWNDVENPQSSGYEAQVATDSAFSAVELQISGQTSSQYVALSLSAGTKFWRVRHAEGNASATTAAVTAWSVVRSFTVGSGAPTVTSVSLVGRTSAFSGTEQVGELQLSGPAPAGGAAVTLTSSDPSAVPVPSTVTIPAGFAFIQFRFIYGQVTTATPVTVTATYGGSSANVSVRVDPPSLKELGPSPNSMTGGSQASAYVGLNGAAPAGGAVVTLTSSSPLVTPPASVTVPAGSFFHSFTLATSQVTTSTTVTITAAWKGVTVTHALTLLPGVPPDTWTVETSPTTGSEGSTARVSIAALQSTDTTFTLTSSNPDVARMSPTVTIPAGSPHAGVLILTTNPAAPTTVTLSVTGAGVTRSATLTVNPIALGPLPGPSLLSPASGARFTPTQSIGFDWSDVTGAASYTLQVGTSSTFTTLVLTRTVTASQLAAVLTAQGDRSWRVRAHRSDGSAGAWSATRSFRVKA